MVTGFVHHELERVVRNDLEVIQAKPADRHSESITVEKLELPSGASAGFQQLCPCSQEHCDNLSNGFPPFPALPLGAWL